MDHSLITAASNHICWKSLSRFDCIFHFPSCMCFGSSWKSPALNIICWLEFKTQEQFRPLGVFAFFTPTLSDSHRENKLSVTWVYVTHFITKVRFSFCSVLKRIVNNYIQYKYINIKIYKYRERQRKLLRYVGCWLFFFKTPPPRGSEWFQEELTGLNAFSIHTSKVWFDTGQLGAMAETPSGSAPASSRVQARNGEQQKLVSFASRRLQPQPLSISGEKKSQKW